MLEQKLLEWTWSVTMPHKEVRDQFLLSIASLPSYKKPTKKAFGTAIAIEHPIGEIEANKGTDIITKHDWRRKSRSITTKLPFSMSSQKARCIFQTGVCT
ncbi:hypothetical protein JI435_115270 [Parastagonospora nodorum SN15]|uniref:Uncharacterized protein n=1 Tax=Phaeosphaeria nodorum (strain SN15 / ATCC MYA-4574 / FGSC 10173) TaxID=321614 RepID=A0A7U2FCN4_PHANO|nr:hypothetical protein HBI76_135890 [Parastagonospora nodorum]QRD02798.1 hypothetical protein JI435_115270 [Parastagonospora nodorum SN15]